MIYNIKNKPYYFRKVIATILDYGLLFAVTFLWMVKYGEPNAEGGYTVTGIYALPPIIFWYVMLPGSEALFSKTLGHWLVGLKVVEVSCMKADFIQTFKRRLADLVDLFFWGIPAIISIRNSAHNQRLGDLWAETAVVSLQDEKERLETTGADIK
ncbi:MAG: RDD family protein [Bacteroidales bacterium]|nr:RDD family protein [Bacteroidales bacterium]